jgi:hypothetical protein
MTKIDGQLFKDSTEVLDGRQFTNCEFRNCTVVYRGGTLPAMNGCHFQDCHWQFEDAAERTMVFMRVLYHGMGEGGKRMVEAAFAQTRQPISAGPAN